MINKFKRLLAIFGYIKDADIKIIKNKNDYKIIKADKVIIIDKKHKIYLFDFVKNFDYFFSAIEPEYDNGTYIADYKSFKAHKIKGYDLHKVIFPSMPEPIDTTFQYIDFANLDENSVVIDLGAYSGLTSILFDREISKNNKNAKGKVIAVEADTINLSCLIQNIQEYKLKTERNIEYLFSAVSDKDGEAWFLIEGSMGASLNYKLDYKNLFRNTIKCKIPTITLSSIAKRFNLEKVDFIKCDIEGGEKDIFNDKEFFKNYSPKIIVEVHNIRCIPTTNKVIESLKPYNYDFKFIKQIGVDLPLIECVRK